MSGLWTQKNAQGIMCRWLAYSGSPVLLEDLLLKPVHSLIDQPLGDLVGAWNEVPESNYGIVQQGQDELRPFSPRRA